MMIVCVKSEELNFKEFYGWGKAFTSFGCEFIFCDKSKKAILDVFYEKKPDVFIVHSNDVDRATRKAILLYEKCKTIIVDGLIDTNYHENIFLLPCPNKSLDIYNFINYKKQERFISDINYVGDYVNTKDNILLDVLNNKDFCVKVWGNTVWPYRQYLGKIKSILIKDIIASCSLSLCSDLSWALQVFACGKPCFIYKPKILCGTINVSDFNCEDESELNLAILNFIKKPDDLMEKVNIIRENIRTNHTSHNRVFDALNIIGLKEEAEKCIMELKKITAKY